MTKKRYKKMMLAFVVRLMSTEYGKRNRESSGVKLGNMTRAMLGSKNLLPEGCASYQEAWDGLHVDIFNLGLWDVREENNLSSLILDYNIIVILISKKY